MLWAYVTYQFEGYHQWLEAPEKVAFLRAKHRHIFHCKVYVEQFHDDRDIEYISFRAWLLDKVIAQFDMEKLGSCEMIAIAIGEIVAKKYSGRKYKVDVSEDGENGAIVSS